MTAGAATFCYDRNGNMVKRNSASYTLTYDAENHLTSVSGGASASFVYDGDGNRVKATLGSTIAYVGDHFEWKGSTSTMVKYYYANGQRIAMRVGSSIRYYLLTDHLGSTAITAYSSGGRKAELRYYAYGGTRYTYGTTPTAYKFTGQRLDESTGLYYYGARYYDPALGRFVQADTIVPEPGNPQALNRYSYVLNNPLRYVDPAGRFACIPGTGGWEGPQKYNIHACAYRLGYSNEAQVTYKEYMMTVAESEAIPSILLAAAILRQTDPAWPDRVVGDEPERFLLTQARSGGRFAGLFADYRDMSVGIGQITPGEAGAFGWSGNLDDLFDPEQSIGFMGAKIAEADAFIQTQAGWTELDRFMLLAIAQNSGTDPAKEFFGKYKREWSDFLFDTKDGRNAQALRDQLWAMLMRIEWLLYEGDWSLPPGIDLQEYRQRLYPGSSGG